MYFIMNNIIEEFKNICKHETIYKTNEIHNNELQCSDLVLGREYREYIDKHNDILFVINCEYDEAPERCTLNYYSQHWGNKAFNELLDKHKLMYEWYDCCVAFVSNDEEHDLTDCKVAI